MKKTTTTITAKRIAIAVAAVCASLSLPAAANDTKAMLDLMLKKGVITQKDYNEFMEANKEADENKAFKESRIDQDVSKSIKDIQKRQNDGSVKENGFGFKSKDGNSELNITGRLHFDGRLLDGDWGEAYPDRDSGALSDRFSVRRARIGATGVFNKNINYEIVTNLVGSNANLLDTAWANYNFKPEAQIRVGRFKQPFGLETLMSSNNIGYMERSYQDQIAPGKQLGVMFHGEQPNSLTYAASAYQTGFDSASAQGGPEYAGRFTFNLAKAMQGVGDDVLLHVGVAGTRGTFQVVPTTSSQDGSNFLTRGAFISFNDEFGGLRNVYRNRINGTPPCSTTTTTGTTGTCDYGGYSLAASDAASVDLLRKGIEVALAKGPFKLQAEYTMGDYTATSASRTAGTSSNFSTGSTGQAKVYYIDLMYNITGEPWAPTYRSGVIGAVRPTNPFDLSTMSGTGAWQVGIRYSSYDASDFGNNTSSTGGSSNFKDGAVRCTSNATNSNACQYQIEGSPKGQTTTLGVNWILNPNARIMFNYSMSSFDYSFLPVDIGTGSGAAKRGDNSRAFMIRSQFNF
jgi:phosphate-selective porin OprO/OprP